jgi:hypothetical protein
VSVATEREEEESEIQLPSVSAREARQYLRIPWQRLLALAQARVSLPAVFVYLLLWRQRMIRRSHTVPLTTAALAPFGLTRHQKAWALDSLERVGLIRVERRRGKNPLVTICGEMSV